MPTRYILSTSLQNIETKFAIPPQSLSIENNYNISPGQFAPVITSEKPHKVQLFRFGLTPFWARSDMLLNTARSEGDYNQSDNPKIKSAAGIILKKAFRKPIRSQRCIVLASAFIEGIKEYGILKPYVVYLRNQQNPFPFAGIWDIWLNPQTGETINSFSIITTTANSLLQKIGSSRMPVILSLGKAKKWINPNTELTTITQMLQKYDSNLMNAYPISSAIKNSFENDKKLIQPIGTKLILEEKMPQIKFHYTSGYHQAKKADNANNNTSLADTAHLTISKEGQTNINQ